MKLITVKIVAACLILLRAFNMKEDPNVKNDKGNADTIKGVSYTTTFPNIFSKKKWSGYLTTQRNIYYYRDQVLYYGSDFLDSMVNGEMVPTTRQVSYYFVYTKGSKYGYYFSSSLSRYSGMKKPVDEFLKTESAYHPYRYLIYDSALVKRNGKLISQQYNNDSTILDRVYTIDGGRCGQASVVPDSLYLRFSKKFTNTQYSLSQKLDSITKMKLIQATFINNPVENPKEFDIFFGEKVITPYIIKEMKIDNREELMRYFDEDRVRHTKNL